MLEGEEVLGGLGELGFEGGEFGGEGGELGVEGLAFEGELVGVVVDEFGFCYFKILDFILEIHNLI